MADYDYTKDPVFRSMDDATKHAFLMQHDPAYGSMEPGLQNEFRGTFKHPWVQFNEASRAGQRPTPGQNFPGAGYVPTKGEAAADVGMLGAGIAAGPLATAATGSAVVAPALARAAVNAAPPLFTGGPDALYEALKRGGTSLGVDTLLSAIGLPRAVRNYRAQGTTPPVAVHQAANFDRVLGPGGGPTPPIVFQRVNSGSTPSVSGGGPTSITPQTVTVQPPLSGRPITGGSSPAAILQESMPHPTPPPLVGEGTRAASVIGAEQKPDESALGLTALYSVLGDYAKRAAGLAGSAWRGGE
jgi:hypothetical protein